MLKKLFIALLPLFIIQTAQSAPTMGSQMMVATPSTLSAQVAEEIMKKKGNVVDVAVAIALTLAVTNPRHAALGGGGFAMIKMGKEPVQVLDFRETAPLKTNKDYYLDKKKDASQTGVHAVGVPGIPAGLWALHKKYGKIHWSILFDTPIKLAQTGHHITGENVKRSIEAKDLFNSAGKKVFLNKKGTPFLPGELVIQKGLASALKLMRNRGIAPFYDGPIGNDIVNTIEKGGGVLSRDDLKKYKVRWLKPIVSQFNGYKIYLMPPPSSGGLIIASSLKMFEKLKMNNITPLSTLEFHYFAEVMKINFRNRNLLGDPDFTKNPTDEFLDDAKITKWVEQIKPDQLLKIQPIAEVKQTESNETTHFSVLDKQGNAVSMTITLNGDFGSKVVSEKYGIALNNEMDDFTTNPSEPNLYGLTQGSANIVEAGKRPLSSMSPTLVEKNKKIVMAIGAPGGPRIITGVLQSLFRVLLRGDNIEQAIHAPRVHHQYSPDVIYIDKKKLPPLSIEALEKLGHKLEVSWGSIVNGVHVNQDGHLEAGFDYRSEGGAGGF